MVELCFFFVVRYSFQLLTTLSCPIYLSLIYLLSITELLSIINHTRPPTARPRAAEEKVSLTPPRRMTVEEMISYMVRNGYSNLCECCAFLVHYLRSCVCVGMCRYVSIRRMMLFCRCRGVYE